MVASRTLYIFLAIGLVFFLAAYLNPVFVSVGLAYDLVLFCFICLDSFITVPARLINADRAISDRLSIGRKNDVTLEVFNQSDARLSLRLRDDVPPGLACDVQEFDFVLAPRAKANLQYTVLPRSRGQYDFGGVKVRYLSRFGLFWRAVDAGSARSVKVYSDLVALKNLSLRLSQSSELGEIRLRKRGQGTDFSTLREYVSGDDSRNIDWKATARRGRPVVRVYEVEQEQTLMVLVDAGRTMVSDLEGLSRFDRALNSALELVLAGLYRNDQVGFGVFADKPLLYLPPRRGKAYLGRILEAVYDLQPALVESDYAGALTFFAGVQKSRSLMAVLTDLTDPSGSQSLLTGLARLSKRHLPFCITMRDRQINAVAADTKMIDETSIFRRAVATDLLWQRDLAFSQLARHGCLVLDCPPQELSEKVVDRYLEVKARGRL